MSQRGPTTWPVVGPDGVPQVHYPWGIEDNPVTVSQWALQHWSWWLETKRADDLAAVTTAADWLVSRQHENGAWKYTFDVTAAGVAVHAPWISAMAQGQAISLLVRAYSATHDQRHLDAARLALRPFELSVEDGGVVADWDGLPWYEEYAAVGANHVLNGYEFALVGLHDLADRDADAGRLFSAGIASLTAHIAVFDAPAARSQYYAAFGGGRFLVDDDYRQAHALLTLSLADWTADTILAAYAKRWAGYLTPAPAPRAAVIVPAIPAPAAALPPLAVVRELLARHVCRLAGRVIRRRGHISCRRARHVLRRYALHDDQAKRWRCRTTRAVVCHRGGVRVSVGRGALRAVDARAGRKGAGIARTA